MGMSRGVGGLALGLQVLTGAWNPAMGAVVQPTAAPAAAKPVAAAAQQTPIFLRGTITARFPSQLNGPGVKGVEVTLLDLAAGGRVVPVDTKVTDAVGRFAFVVLPAERGKHYAVRPRLTQACCQGCWGFEPPERTFTVQGGETLDFKIVLPSPDLALSTVGVKSGNPYEGVDFTFQIANRGCLASVAGSLKLSFAQPCCPDKCSRDVPFYSVGPQQTATVEAGAGWNSGGRGCPFTATIPAQQFEVSTQDNIATGTSPNLKLPDFQVRSDGTLIHVANKGTGPGTVTLEWKCPCAAGGTFCPALLPATPGAPAFQEASRGKSVKASVTIGGGGDIAFTIPPWKSWVCNEGTLAALVNPEAVYEHDHAWVAVTFR